MLNRVKAFTGPPPEISSRVAFCKIIPRSMQNSRDLFDPAKPLSQWPARSARCSAFGGGLLVPEELDKAILVVRDLDQQVRWHRFGIHVRTGVEQGAHHLQLTRLRGKH
jgi:hypothetical protein